MPTTATREKGRIAAWAAWDWGSAAFNAVATTFVFSAFLVKPGVFASGDYGTKALSLGLTIAGFIIAVLAPIIGQRADDHGRSKFLVGVYSLLVTLCLAGTFLVHPNSPLGAYWALWLGVTLLCAGSIFFEFASVSYNAMLPQVSTPKTIGRISGLGWGMGYLGGIFLLLILYVGFIAPEVGWFGVSSENNLNIRVAMLVATCWFGLFAIPVLFLKMRPVDQKLVKIGMESGAYDAKLGYRKLWNTIKELKRDAPNTLRFMVASAIFRDGLAGVFAYGAILGTAVFGLDSDSILIFGIVSNVVAGLFTVAFGYLDDRLGARKVIIGSLFCMVLCGFALFIGHNGGAIVYWVFGLLLCIFVGPIQSASRSFLVRVIPAGREGEIFGLYATTGRAVSFLAPMLFGIFLWIGSWFVPEGETQYWGVLGITSILLLGLLLMLLVKEENSEEAVR